MSNEVADSVIAIRGRYVLSRIVQAVGFYLVFAGILDMFAAPLRVSGIPIDAIPDVLWQPYQTMPVNALFVFLIGLGVVWFATSPWFLGSLQK